MQSLGESHIELGPAIVPPPSIDVSNDPRSAAQFVGSDGDINDIIIDDIVGEDSSSSEGKLIFTQFRVSFRGVVKGYGCGPLIWAPDLSCSSEGTHACACPFVFNAITSSCVQVYTFTMKLRSTCFENCTLTLLYARSVHQLSVFHPYGLVPGVCR